MKTTTIVEHLCEAARKLGLTVRSENGNFKGGRCMVAGEPVLMLNKRHPPEVRLAVLARGLRDLPVETIYLKPSVRAALEEEWERLATLEEQNGSDGPEAARAA